MTPGEIGERLGRVKADDDAGAGGAAIAGSRGRGRIRILGLIGMGDGRMVTSSLLDPVVDVRVGIGVLWRDDGTFCDRLNRCALVLTVDGLCHGGLCHNGLRVLSR